MLFLFFIKLYFQSIIKSETHFYIILNYNLALPICRSLCFLVLCTVSCTSPVLIYTKLLIHFHWQFHRYTLSAGFHIFYHRIGSFLISFPSYTFTRTSSVHDHLLLKGIWKKQKAADTLSSNASTASILL